VAILKSSDVDAFVARPDPARTVVLVLGPDAGAVSERVDALIRASVDDVSDPFSVNRIEGEELSIDPQKLVDAAQTMPLFGGRRAIYVRAGSRNITAAVEPLTKLKLVDTRVVIEAGDLKRNAPLRALCERATSAVVVPCYADTDRELGRLIDDEMRGAGLTISADARAALIPLLGGDRRASRNELRKLTTYAAGSGSVDLDAVLAVVADASALALDEVIDAAFAGQAKDLDLHFKKAIAAGTTPSSIIFAAQRQLGNLHKARLSIEDGSNVTQQLEAMRVHFSRKNAVESALKAWTAVRLARSMQELAEAQLRTRMAPALADAVTQRALIGLAIAARRKE
jgi:DNA polymerase-3 subunit delta